MSGYYKTLSRFRELARENTATPRGAMTADQDAARQRRLSNETPVRPGETYVESDARMRREHDEDRAACDCEGELGHWQCGVCHDHAVPRTECGCYLRLPDECTTLDYRSVREVRSRARMILEPMDRVPLDGNWKLNAEDLLMSEVVRADFEHGTDARQHFRLRLSCDRMGDAYVHLETHAQADAADRARSERRALREQLLRELDDDGL
jgi:hypothetical protein